MFLNTNYQQNDIFEMFIVMKGTKKEKAQNTIQSFLSSSLFSTFKDYEEKQDRQYKVISKNIAVMTVSFA